MEDIINICLRSILVLILLFFAVKMLGKKQVSQLSLFDYVVGITIGSIAADISLDLEKDLIAGIASLLLYGGAAYIISIITLKSITARRIFSGVPTVLVENGKIIESGLRRAKLNVNDLLAEARVAGYFDLSEINYAIMEIGGDISFLPMEKEKPATKKDMKIKCEDGGLTANGIIDGTYMKNNVEAMGKDKKWLDHELKVQGFDNYDDILLATIDINEKVTVYRKNVIPKKNTVLE